MAAKASANVPTVGTVVLYRLSAEDADRINRAREHASPHAAHYSAHGLPIVQGNPAAEGDVFPMMITRTWGDEPDSAVNGHVMLDGNDPLWATSVTAGEEPGTFSWPERA